MNIVSFLEEDGENVMVTYQITEELLWDQEMGRYIAFGVCAYLEDETGRREVAHISDVFFCTETAARFVDKCNRLELDVDQLYDAVEDILLDDDEREV